MKKNRIERLLDYKRAKPIKWHRHFDWLRQNCFMVAIVRENGIQSPQTIPIPGDMVITQASEGVSSYQKWYYRMGGDCYMLKATAHAPACLTDHLRQAPELPQAERDDFDYRHDWQK